MTLKALIIDDDADLTTLVGRFLANAGFSVEATTSGKEGLRRALALKPDLAMVDIMMPDLDGYEVCRRLRADPRTRRATIVVLTARAQPVDKQMALRSGADAHIVKPFNGKALVEEIKQLMAARAMQPAPLGVQATILHLKPGVGATTVAANLALALAQIARRVAVAVDLSAGVGQIGPVLGLLPGEPWGEMLGDDRPAAEMPDLVFDHVARHSSGLLVLTPPSGSSAAMPGAAAIGQVLSVLRGGCDYLVVDTPVALGPLASAVLGSSSVVLLLVTPDAAALRAAKLSLAAIDKCAPTPPQVWPVLNGAPPEWQAYYPHVEQALGLPVAAVLPWSREECARALATRTPVVLGQPGSALALAIGNLAKRVAALPPAQPSK